MHFLIELSYSVTSSLKVELWNIKVQMTHITRWRRGWWPYYNSQVAPLDIFMDQLFVPTKTSYFSQEVQTNSLSDRCDLNRYSKAQQSLFIDNLTPRFCYKQQIKFSDFEHKVKLYVKKHLANSVAHQHCLETVQRNIQIDCREALSQIMMSSKPKLFVFKLKHSIITVLDKRETENIPGSHLFCPLGWQSNGKKKGCIAMRARD